MNSHTSECPVEVKKSHDGIVLVKPLGQFLTGQSWVDKLRGIIDDIIERRTNPRVIIDMSMVEHLSSSLLGELIGMYRKLDAVQGQLRLAAVQPSVNEIFHITRLHQSFNIQTDIDKAAQSFD
jgi:anti-anti-sigma factor